LLAPLDLIVLSLEVALAEVDYGANDDESDQIPEVDEPPDMRVKGLQLNDKLEVFDAIFAVVRVVTVAEGTGDSETTDFTDAHADQTVVPSLNHFLMSLAKPKGVQLFSPLGRIKDASALDLCDKVDRHKVAELGFLVAFIFSHGPQDFNIEILVFSLGRDREAVEEENGGGGEENDGKKAR